MSSKVAEDKFTDIMIIKVCAADKLPSMDMNGKADPFCVLKLGDREVGKTTVKRKTREPVWNETFRVLIYSLEAKYNLDIEVFDWDKMSKNDYVGSATIDLAQYKNVGKRDIWLPITLVDKGGKEKSRGDIHVEITHLNRPEIERIFWSGIVEHFDVDGDGEITKLEFDGLLAGIDSPMNPTELDALFKKLDSNKDDGITFDEFYKMVSDPTMANDPLVKKLLPADPNLIGIIVSLMNDRSTVGELVMSDSRWKNQTVTSVVTRELGKGDKILVHDRATGKMVEEKIPNYIKVAMRMMYGSATGRLAVDSGRIKKVLKSLTVKQGKKYNDPGSVADIDPFIEYHQLSREEMLDDVSAFQNFNEFFYRKLKATARPIAALDDPKVLTSPADCRLNVFETITKATEIWIKGKNFSLLQLLQDNKLANKYDGGALVICRLAPQDYHRFHVPYNCTFTKSTPIDGTYYTVNPIAVNQTVDVYSENKREICNMKSPEFGDSLYICVGATMVGSIELTAKIGQRLQKGDEQGYFAFGGSTILVLFEKGKVVFDEDLLLNSSKPLETLVKMGERIGRTV